MTTMILVQICQVNSVSISASVSLLWLWVCLAAGWSRTFDWISSVSNSWMNYYSCFVNLNSISYPSPVSAQQDCMCQGWSLMELRVRYLEISAADIQPFISCLLANINTDAFRRSWERWHRANYTYQTITLLSATTGPQLLNCVFGWKSLTSVENECPLK